MGNYYDITGCVFERLTVIRRIPNKSQRTTRWLCQCSCGSVIESNKNNLVNGHTKSCGCLAHESSRGNKYRETHGQSRGRLYHIWQSMKQRCLDPKTKEYRLYGARGITVCQDWMVFENFYDWAIKSGYQPNLTIDRIDNFKGYFPDNCKWSTVLEQNRNKRTNRILEFNGRRECMGFWSQRLEIPMSTISNRLNRGCSDSEALNTDYKKHRDCGIETLPPDELARMHEEWGRRE